MARKPRRNPSPWSYIAYLPFQKEPLLLEEMQSSPDNEDLEEASERIASILGLSSIDVRTKAMQTLAGHLESYEDPSDALKFIETLDERLARWVGVYLVNVFMPGVDARDARRCFLSGRVSSGRYFLLCSKGQYQQYWILNDLRKSKSDKALMEAIIDAVNDYPPPTDRESRLKRRARDPWYIPEELSPLGKRAAEKIKQVLGRYDALYTGGQRVFWSPREWLERGEIGSGAELIVVHDGGAHRPFFIGDDDWSLAEKMSDELKLLGFYVEPFNSWSSGVYVI